MSLEGKTVVVTGGGSGIGESCAIELAKLGCHVLIAGRNADKLQSVANAYDGPGKIECCVVDVSDRESVGQLFEEANRVLGQVDILVNSAGMNTPKRSMEDLAPADWDRVMTVNATGAYNCMYAVLPQMRERKDGLIINISSISGIRAGLLGGVAYNASKFAMSALGTTVGQETCEQGIRISNVYPGEVETPILDERPVPVTAEHRARILQPEDVSAAVVMIAQLPPRANVSEIVVKPTSQPLA